MSCSDFVADFLTVIRNATVAHKEVVTLKSSKACEQIAEILKSEGFIGNCKTFSEGPKKFLRIQMKYLRGKKPAIQGIKKISKPGCRVYSGCEDIKKVRSGLGIAIISTSKGVMTDRQARQAKVGGEILCTVW